MRAVILAVGLALGALAASSWARADERAVAPMDLGIRAHAPRDAVIAEVGIETLGLAYVHALAPRWAIQVGAAFFAPRSGPVNVVGIMFRSRALFHPLGRAPYGPWIALSAMYGSGFGEREGLGPFGVGASMHPAALGTAGLSAGYAWRWRRLFGSIGGGAQVRAVHVLGGSGPPNLADVGPVVDTAFGYAF